MKAYILYFRNTIVNKWRAMACMLTCLLVLGLFSCSPDDETTPANELDGLAKIQDVAAGAHTLELYSESGSLQQGYNAISIRIKDNGTGNYETDASISWMPVMHMMSMTHSCPFSAVGKTSGKNTLYSGYVIFQMAQNTSEYWTMQIDYTVDGVSYSANCNLDVPASARQRVASFIGNDAKRYIVALVGPENPQVAVNDMSVAVYKMDSMMSFVPVDGYSLKIDPRMPGMGNHGSPNNTDLVQSSTDSLYHGDLSLTMTGYWCVNLQLLSPEGDILKGEPVTDEIPQSSLYLEIEF